MKCNAEGKVQSTNRMSPLLLSKTVFTSPHLDSPGKN